jgi:hypothetical protein
MPDDLTRDSVQTRPDVMQATPGQSVLSGWLQVLAQADDAPRYWSRARDAWLREFVISPGNDLLAGTIATVVAKVAGTGWYIEGPERTANAYRRMLLEFSDFGAGWDTLISKLVYDYLTQDAGAWAERIRGSKQGTCLGVAHLDAAQVWITGNPEYPALYATSFQADADEDKRDWQKLHRSQVIHLVDTPSPRERMLNVGFCAVSRALTTARILMDIARYEREKLSDLPPAGLLLLNNLSQQQWGDLQKSYDTRQQQQGNTVWRQVMVAFGLDPSVPLSAEFKSFSELPEAFDKQTTTELAIYSFALAFRIDPREIWPASSGSLGTATETEVMHIKALTKGAGLLLTQIERAINDGFTLPPSCSFRFDSQDSDEDRRQMAVADAKAAFIRRLWEPAGLGEGILSREEARAWLVREGLFEETDLLVYEDDTRSDDSEQAKGPYAVDLGPRVRCYQNGRMMRLEVRRQPVVRAEGETVRPRGRPLAPWGRAPVPITSEDVAAAMRTWDMAVPEAAGLLMARKARAGEA